MSILSVFPMFVCVAVRHSPRIEFHLKSGFPSLLMRPLPVDGVLGPRFLSVGLSLFFDAGCVLDAVAVFESPADSSLVRVDNFQQL